jgi:ABC-type glycerol-3-phosphate transport system permease component
MNSPNYRAKIILTMLFFLVIIFNLLPYIALVLGSILPNSKIDRGVNITDIKWLTFNNYISLFNDLSHYLLFLYNSIYISFTSSIIVLVSSFLGAYFITRHDFKGKLATKLIVFSGYLLPPIILVIPYMLILKFLSLNGSLLGVVIANILFCFPFGFWLMIQYFENVPIEFDRTAIIDGANWFQTLWYILLPRVLPGMSAVILFSFILSWNDVALSFFLLDSENKKPLAVGFKEYILETTRKSSYGSFAAASVILATVAAFVFGLIQYYVDSSLRKEAKD